MRRPFVILNAAMTLDGKIATRTGDSAISSEEDLLRVHRLRASCDAIMVGVSTVLTDDPRLTVHRLPGRNPVRVIVDSRARTPITARVLTVSRETPTMIAVTSLAPRSRVKRLIRAGAKIIFAGRKSKVDLRVLLGKLRAMGLRRILVEGGGNLNWSMVMSGLVDRVSIAVAPVIVGGRSATTLVEGDGVAHVKDGVRLRLIRKEKFGDDLVLTYKVLK